MKQRYRTMKKSKINPISDKQKEELALRSRLKAELIAEFGEHCMTCNDKNRDCKENSFHVYS